MEISSAATAIYRRLLKAWNTRDANAFASLFAADGHVVGFDGSQMEGRDTIQSELGAIFAHHPTAAYVAKIREISQLDPKVAVLRAVVGMVPPGKHEIKPDVNAIQSVVFVQTGERLEIALLQNTPAAFHGRPELVEQLTAELTDVLRSGVLAGERD